MPPYHAQMRRTTPPCRRRGRAEQLNRGAGQGVTPDRYEYEKALCVQVQHLKQRQVILSDNVNEL